jgi:CheY-like chemotaxis protein
MIQQPHLSPLLFLLEDDEERATQLEKQALKFGWQVAKAGSLECALRIARKKHAEIKLALIDIMVPELETDLTDLRDFKRRRRELAGPILKAHTDPLSNLTELRQIDAELSAIDTAMRLCIVENGGAMFLQEAAGERWLQNWHYAIFSAVSQKNIESELKNHGLCKDPNYLGWIEKPASSEAMADLFIRYHSANRKHV